MPPGARGCLKSNQGARAGKNRSALTLACVAPSRVAGDRWTPILKSICKRVCYAFAKDRSSGCNCRASSLKRRVAGVDKFSMSVTPLGIGLVVLLGTVIGLLLNFPIDTMAGCLVLGAVNGVFAAA